MARVQSWRSARSLAWVSMVRMIVRPCLRDAMGRFISRRHSSEEGAAFSCSHSWWEWDATVGGHGCRKCKGSGERSHGLGDSKVRLVNGFSWANEMAGSHCWCSARLGVDHVDCKRGESQWRENSAAGGALGIHFSIGCARRTDVGHIPYLHS